jgi:sugar phosphate isomerase/epimerase
MLLGLFAKTFEGKTPDSVLAAAAAAGFSAVQYNMACSGLPSMPDEIPVSVAKNVVIEASKNRLSVAALSGTYNMIHPDPAVRSKGHERLATLAAAAVAMQTKLITLCTGTRNPDDQWSDHPENRSEEAWKDLLASMEIAIGIAERYDICLGVEPELANVVNSAHSARRLLDEIKSPHLKIVLDPANLFEIVEPEVQKHLISEAIDLLADSIAMGHAKDRTASGGFIAAGMGVLDYSHYLACMKRIHFDGPIVTHGLSAMDAGAVSSFLRTEIEQAGFTLETPCSDQ